jgi:NADH-quinone oxidoreductase subunit J
MLLSLFYLLSFLSILFALLVVVSKNPMHSVLYLILTFFTIAGHYVLLNAQFLAAVHVIVYAGAIMVLFLYVIMLLNLNAETEPHKNKWLKVAATVSGGLLMVILVGALRSYAVTFSRPAADIGMIKSLGKVLYNEFMLPFEISSILFLAAMVGVVMLGKKEVQ